MLLQEVKHRISKNLLDGFDTCVTLDYSGHLLRKVSVLRINPNGSMPHPTSVLNFISKDGKNFENLMENRESHCDNSFYGGLHEEK